MQGHSISAAAVVPSASRFLDGYVLLALVASGSAAPGQNGASHSVRHFHLTLRIRFQSKPLIQAMP
jgi:hypothetical protein